MSTISTALGATCLALASFCAMAQTGAPGATGAPPTHPAAGGSGATSTPSPTTPPTHPAGGTSGATPDATRKQNQSSDASKEAAAARDNATRANVRSTDPAAKDNMPKHPAAQSK